MAHRAATPSRPPFWRDPRVRSLIVQAVVLVLVVAFVAYLARNLSENLRLRGIASGFGFLTNTAGFGVSFNLIPYSEASSYGRVLLVGILNTILVAVLGIVLATILGFVIGLARLSRNWLVAKLATAYVEFVRNVPLLLQLIFWYTAVLSALPSPRDGYGLGGVIFLNNRGLNVPRPVFGEGAGLILWALLLAVVLTVGLAVWARRRREATGRMFPTFWAGLSLLVGLPLLGLLVAGLPVSFEPATATRFSLRGGLGLPPELVALLLGLTLYTASFIAEIVRAGILAVNRGQIEAAGALGLRPGTTTRLVVVPQALRVIIPPLGNQYLNLTKNSSLAVAVGYPDLVSVGGTTLNQTGQAVEVVAVWMAVYLSLSLTTSLLLNWYNRRMALVER